MVAAKDCWVQHWSLLLRSLKFSLTGKKIHPTFKTNCMHQQLSLSLQAFPKYWCFLSQISFFLKVKRSWDAMWRHLRIEGPNPEQWKFSSPIPTFERPKLSQIIISCRKENFDFVMFFPHSEKWKVVLPFFWNSKFGTFCPLCLCEAFGGQQHRFERAGVYL